MTSSSPTAVRGPRGQATDEMNLLRAAMASVRTIGSRSDLLREGDVPAEAYLVLDGWGMRYKDLPEGRRQIMAFLLPGDLCLNAADEPISHCVSSLTTLKYAAVPLARFEQSIATTPELFHVVWRKKLGTSAIYLEWLGNSGRPAYDRVAHLLCELFARAQAAGLADGNSCDFPATQFDLACALGLTAVHINRTLQHLRRDGLIELRGKRLFVRDGGALSRAAQFDREYLLLHSAEG